MTLIARVRHARARRSATRATVVGTTIVASLLYAVSGNWMWAHTIETAPDGRPLTVVQLSGAASAWGELVVLLLGVVAWTVLRDPGALRSVRRLPGAGRLTADRLLIGMWVFVAAVWVLTIAHAVVATLLVRHGVVPPFLVNGTVDVRHL